MKDGPCEKGLFFNALKFVGLVVLFCAFKSPVKMLQLPTKMQTRHAGGGGGGGGGGHLNGQASRAL